MVALASPKRRSAPDVQESALPEVAFYAKMVGNGDVYVQIRKKDKNTFAVWISGIKVRMPIDEKISRKVIKEAIKTGTLCHGVKIKIKKSDLDRIEALLSEE